ncbi:hypothetical protein [Hydrogenimonas thermophila]|uniref:Uncharacterized protein n=1 Tax=Hydrogenimonas thermophila TaxID=223786 RepID=A0A1I5LER8_9BACT|nr:hypothetical protein [Hydrogenimonas thermophila]SFO95859.1 hypothetical protein SAMN05216234_1033 [Hydrogenimonas thermophila]
MYFKSNIFNDISFIDIDPKSLFIIWLFKTLDMNYIHHNRYIAEFAKYLL